MKTSNVFFTKVAKSDLLPAQLLNGALFPDIPGSRLPAHELKACGFRFHILIA